MPSTSHVPRAIVLLLAMLLVTAPVDSGVPTDDSVSSDMAGSRSSGLLDCGRTAPSPGSSGASENVSLDTLVAPGEHYERLTNASAFAVAREQGALTPASVGVDRTWVDQEVAYTDLAVLRFTLSGSATGLLDRLAAQNAGSPSENFRALVSTDQVDFGYRGATSCPPELALNASIDNGSFRVVPDRENDTLYLVLDIDRLRFVPPGGDEPTTDTYVVGHNGFALELNASSGLTPSTVELSDSYDVVPAAVHFDGASDGLVSVSASANQTLTGQTTLAPGSELDVMLRPVDGNVSAIHATVAVDRTRQFAGSVDLSAVPNGTVFGVSVPETRDSQAVEAGDTLVAVGNATTALVNVTDQESPRTVLYPIPVSSTDGGFVVVENASGHVVATSEFVEPGTTVVSSEFSTPLSMNQTVTVVVYRDANGNRQFDDADVPYRRNGSVVSDSASVKIIDDPQSGTPTARPTPSPTATLTATTPAETETATPSTALPSPVTGQSAPNTATPATTPGFGPLAALVSLAVVALISVRWRRTD